MLMSLQSPHVPTASVHTHTHIHTQTYFAELSSIAALVASRENHEEWTISPSQKQMGQNGQCVSLIIMERQREIHLHVR